ncbi:MAG: Asp-tRNA(Asn)/Glu-tRNA(Gln) amidotransferase GatCAB subunit C [Thermoprotei archaeon]|nr:MAG: Asp-tRNA(Asn)/Glu-tRNA(Gln) amidotransferase GatCAB subunit C [Thermoprotei archaeon]
MAEINEETIKHLAWLARLKLSEDEIKEYVGQLSKILDYFKILDEAPTENVEPLFHVLDLVNVMRDDEPGETLSVDEALSNAPLKEGNYIEAPRMVT